MPSEVRVIEAALRRRYQRRDGRAPVHPSFSPDTVVSTKTIHHAAGSLTDNGMVYRKVRGPLAGQMTSWFYKPDGQLLALAKAAMRTYAPDEITVEGNSYRPRVVTGVVSASDLFGVSDEKIADLKAKLDPDIMEMESAAIAQVR